MIAEKHLTTSQVAARFNELAQKEKWFELQDELFSEDVISIEPEHAPHLKNAAGKEKVREKGMNWVKRVTAVHHLHTSEPVIAGNHFAVAREADITVEGLGRIQMNEIMVYEVKNGKIVSEQFIY